MSVLSNPQGTPERVWSLVAGLGALDSVCILEDLEKMLNPGYVREGSDIRASETLAGDALDAATSLGLILLDDEEARLGLPSLPANLASFADEIHERLCDLDPAHVDAVLLEMFAWVAAESDRQGGVAWIYQGSNKTFADKAGAALVSETVSHTMNATRIPAWRRWTSFLGLSVVMPQRGVPDFPLISARLLREMERAPAFTERSMSAEAFLNAVALRLPYLDRGRLFKQACERIGHRTRPLTLSPLLSMALRDLHDRKMLELQLVGDSPDKLLLSTDNDHPISAFDRVLRPEGTAS